MNPSKNKNNPEKKVEYIDPAKVYAIEERSKLESGFERNPPIEDDPDKKILRSEGRHNETKNRG